MLLLIFPETDRRGAPCPTRTTAQQNRGRGRTVEGCVHLRREGVSGGAGHWVRCRQRGPRPRPGRANGLGVADRGEVYHPADRYHRTSARGERERVVDLERHPYIQVNRRYTQVKATAVN